MLIWLVLQSVATAGPPADLRTPVRSVRCRPGDGDEITVCGRGQQSPYRLKRLEAPAPDRPIRAEVGLGKGARVSAVTQEAGLPGASAKRAMVRLTSPF